MTPLEKCRATLLALIRVGDPNGLPLAEKAIDEFVASHVGGNRQTDAILKLQTELEPSARGAVGAHHIFIETVYDYTEAKLRALHGRKTP